MQQTVAQYHVWRKSSRRSRQVLHYLWRSKPRHNRNTRQVMFLLLSRRLTWLSKSCLYATLKKVVDVMKLSSHFKLCSLSKPRAYAWSGFGVNPLELDNLQKLYYLRRGDWLFLHSFCLLICWLNANTTK